ncbi:MAG: glycosyltransferase [Lentisphaeria bacterium]|nr:glycosyltransferase [Lentisphaeria bacterium]
MMISVLMRSHNNMLFVKETVEALLAQELDDTVEILSCDDHSTDGTAEYLASVPQIRRITPPEGKYVPGRTLNHMIREAQGDFIIFNNADAVPQHKEYLKNLTEPLKDSSVNCVFANQIARRDAFAVVRKDYERSFGDGSISRHWNKFFSLVSAGMRKEELTQHPFDETFQYSEDAQWVYRREVKIVYVPEAIVEHSHNYTLPGVEKRFFNEGVADARMGKKSPGVLRTWKTIAAETVRDWFYIAKRGEWQEFFYAPRYRYVQKMSYYRGSKK